MIFLVDGHNKVPFLHFSSQKSKHVAISSTSAETLTLFHGSDTAFLLQHNLEAILNQDIPTLMLVDSEQLFKTFTRAKKTTERRLMVDIAAAREAYHHSVISNIAPILSDYNPADGLTKVALNGALMRSLSINLVDYPILHYVIETA